MQCMVYVVYDNGCYRIDISESKEMLSSIFLRILTGSFYFFNTEPPPAYASHPKATVVTMPTAAWVRCRLYLPPNRNCP